MAILIDTSIYYALFDPDDEYHLDATSLIYHIIKGRYGRPYTIDYVVVETTLLLKARNLTYKIPLFIRFLQSEDIKIIYIDNKVFKESLEVLIREPEASLTDVAQLIMARNMKIKFIATLDQWFKHKGLHVLGKNYLESLPRKEQEEIKSFLRKIKKQ